MSNAETLGVSELDKLDKIQSESTQKDKTQTKTVKESAKETTNVLAKEDKAVDSGQRRKGAITFESMHDKKGRCTNVYKIVALVIFGQFVLISLSVALSFILGKY